MLLRNSKHCLYYLFLPNPWTESLNVRGSNYLHLQPIVLSSVRAVFPTLPQFGQQHDVTEPSRSIFSKLCFVPSLGLRTVLLLLIFVLCNGHCCTDCFDVRDWERRQMLEIFVHKIYLFINLLIYLITYRLLNWFIYRFINL